MADLSQIRISGIPAIFPASSFEDRIYIESRVIRNKNASIEVVLTPEKFRTTDNQNSSNNLKVQTRYYDAYDLEFVFKESVNVNLVKIGERIVLYTDEGHALVVEFVSLDVSNIDDTFNYLYTLTVREIKDNAEAISNHLESDKVLSEYTTKGANNLSFYDGVSQINLWTIIQPIYLTQDPFYTDQATMPNGTTIITNDRKYKVAKLRFYVKEDRKNWFLNNKNLRLTQILNLLGTGISYNAVKACDFDISNENLVDLYQMDVTFYYELINYDTFAQTLLI